MISKSKASVFLEDTLNITGLQRPELIPIAAHLVKSKQAKNVGEAINMLDTGTIDVNEIRDLIIVPSLSKNKAFFSFTTLFYLIVTMDERQINAKLVPEKFLKLE